MKDIEKIKQLIKEGFTNSEICKEHNMAMCTIALIRSKLNFPTTKVIRLLNANPQFELEFTELYNNSNRLLNLKPFVQEHPIFKRTNISFNRLSEIRSFYNLPCKMFENHYTNDSDRIKGYIIRNTKFMANRKNIDFNLTYSDLEIPEYCPLLGIKLTYFKESGGNDPSHASVDRIDNSKGYVKGNIIIISRLANAMKNEATFDQLENFSKNILVLIEHYKNQGALGSITDVFKNITFKLNLDS